MVRRAVLGWLTVAGCGAPAATPDARPADAAVDAGAVWATYTIAVGAHYATVSGGGPGSPRDGLSELAGRDYQFRFDASARYVLTDPVEPNDQLDWNKLPGYADCGVVDLAVAGAMFGWRWRPDLEVLELTAYANADGVHQSITPALVALTGDELAATLRYQVHSDGDRYRFAIDGAAGARPIAARGELPRGCPAEPALGLRLAAGLYFGGTSPAPSVITGQILESPP